MASVDSSTDAPTAPWSLWSNQLIGRERTAAKYFARQRRACAAATRVASAVWSVIVMSCWMPTTAYMSAKKWTRRTASAVSAVLKLSSKLPKMMSCAGWFRPLTITVTKAAAYMATSLHDA